MASSSTLVGEVLDTLFEHNSDISDEDISEDDDKGCIYGYLGGRILYWLEPPADFPNEDKVLGTSGSLSVAESFLEDWFEDMDDGSHLLSDLTIRPSDILGETSEHVIPEAQPKVEFYSEAFQLATTW